MHSIFIDSTTGLVVGLLDPQFKWIEYLALDEKKPSEIIHTEILNLLSRHGLKLRETRLFVSSGPGSYTGMRLSEGLAQVFELSQIPVFSFYHFEVPRLTGVEKGYWATNAFKGQVFIYSWDQENAEKQLVNKEDFTINSKAMGFTLDGNDPLFAECSTTKNLIRNESQKLFSKVFEMNLRVEPYYFRTLEEEFR